MKRHRITKHTYLTLPDYRRDLITIISDNMGLNRFQRREILNGSEGEVFDAWWNGKDINQLAKEIQQKDLELLGD